MVKRLTPPSSATFLLTLKPYSKIAKSDDAVITTRIQSQRNGSTKPYSLIESKMVSCTRKVKF